MTEDLVKNSLRQTEKYIAAYGLEKLKIIEVRLRQSLPHSNGNGNGIETPATAMDIETGAANSARQQNMPEGNQGTKLEADGNKKPVKSRKDSIWLLWTVEITVIGIGWMLFRHFFGY